MNERRCAPARKVGEPAAGAVREGPETVSAAMVAYRAELVERLLAERRYRTATLLFSPAGRPRGGGRRPTVKRRAPRGDEMNGGWPGGLGVSAREADCCPLLGRGPA